MRWNELSIYLRSSGLSRRFNVLHGNNQSAGNQRKTRPTSRQPRTSNRSYAYEGDDWGERDESYEQELYSQEYEHDLWDTEDANQDEGYHEEYTAEHEEAEHEDDQEASPDSEDQDEDDQGNYD